MKRLATAILISSALLMTAQVVRADDNYAPMKRHSSEQMLERMTKKLNLTEEQQKNIKPVLEEQFQKMRELRKESREKIESYLTDEQKQQLKQRMESRKKHCKKDRRDD